MRIGFAGVAHSHPFSDARNLQTLGAEVAGVWDLDDPDRQVEFAKEFTTPVFATLDALLDAGIDVLIATPRTERAATMLSALATSNIPCFMNKTIANSETQLDAIDHGVTQLSAPFFTSSVLRFAPAVEAFARALTGRKLLSLQCEVQHDIGPFLTPERQWQDDPHGAGGTMINMGIHGWEMIDVALSGTPVTVLDARSIRAQPTRTSSEDAATVEAITDDEIPVSLHISGTAGPSRYSMHASTAEGPVTMRIGESDPMIEQGFVRLAEIVAGLANGTKSPIAWAQSQRLYRTMIRATDMARQHHSEWFRPAEESS